MNKIIRLASIILFILLPLTKILCESPEVDTNWQLSMKWESVPLSEITMPDTSIKIIDGYADISLTIYNPELSNETSFKAEGYITKCKIYLSQWDEEINQINGNFIIEDKELKLNSLEGQFKDIPFNAQATVDLTSPYPFNAEIKAKDVMLEKISTFLPFLKKYNMIKTPAEAEFNIKGVLPSGPLEGIVILQTASFYSILMNNVEISFLWSDNKILLRNFSANLDEGKISGEGEIFIKQKSSE